MHILNYKKVGYGLAEMERLASGGLYRGPHSATTQMKVCITSQANAVVISTNGRTHLRESRRRVPYLCEAIPSHTSTDI